MWDFSHNYLYGLQRMVQRAKYPVSSGYVGENELLMSEEIRTRYK